MCKFLECLYRAYQFVPTLAEMSANCKFALRDIIIYRDGTMAATDSRLAYVAHPTNMPVHDIFALAYGKPEHYVTLELLPGMGKTPRKPKKLDTWVPNEDNVFTALNCKWGVVSDKDHLKKPAPILDLPVWDMFPRGGFMPCGEYLKRRISLLMWDCVGFYQHPMQSEDGEPDTANAVQLAISKKSPAITGRFDLTLWPKKVPFFREVYLAYIRGMMREEKTPLLLFRQGKEKAVLMPPQTD